jgi:hypothetical protein
VLGKIIILSGLIFCLPPASGSGLENVPSINPIEKIRQALAEETGDMRSKTSYNFGSATTVVVCISPETET